VKKKKYQSCHYTYQDRRENRENSLGKKDPARCPRATAWVKSITWPKTEGEPNKSTQIAVESDATGGVGQRGPSSREKAK